MQWYEIGNFLFTGIPLFFLGYFFHAKPEFFRAAKGKELIIILIGIFVTYIESFALRDSYLSLGQIAVASSLLCLCINNSDIKGGFLALLGSRYSLYIILYHCQIRGTAKIFIRSHPYRLAFVTLIVSIIAAVIIDAAGSFVRDRKSLALR